MRRRDAEPLADFLSVPQMALQPCSIGQGSQHWHAGCPHSSDAPHASADDDLSVSTALFLGEDAEGVDVSSQRRLVACHTAAVHKDQRSGGIIENAAALLKGMVLGHFRVVEREGSGVVDTAAKISRAGGQSAVDERQSTEIED